MVVFECENDSVSLRNPDFNDTLNLKLRVTSSRAMDGTLRTYRHTPAIRNIKLVFSKLSEDKAIEVISFLRTNIGKTLKYTDHDGVKWFCKTIGDPSYSNPGRYNSTLAIEFEGYKDV